MHTSSFSTTTSVLAALLLSAAATSQADPAGSGAGASEPPSPYVIPGDRLPAGAFGPGRIVSMAELAAASALEPADTGPVRRKRNDAHGEWYVPSRKRLFHGAHSGDRYVINKWGDTRMAIGFGEPVDLAGAWFAGNSTRGAWAHGVMAVGFREDVEVARTKWFDDVDDTSSFFEMNLRRVDRVEIHAGVAVQGAGWFGMDDLTFTRAGDDAATVLDFEQLAYDVTLTETNYGGLVWELGAGSFDGEPRPVPVPAPQTPPGFDERPMGGDDDDDGSFELVVGGGTAPTLIQDFVGPRMNETGTFTIPPDTCGAVGIDYFIAIVNSNISIYEKATGVRVLSQSLGTFWNVGNSPGDPRIIFDHHSDRWIALATNFNQRIYIAVSMTSDPLGSWYTNWFNPAQGQDAGKWPDYPTLGVDADGIYTCAYMVGGTNQMSIFALDKAPLLTATPSIGTVTAWRLLPWEGAIQPCVTFGNPGSEYLVSRQNATQIRVRRIDGPLTSPTLTNVGSVNLTATASEPSGVPSLGSNVDLDSGGSRLMNAVYRNGSVWTAHTARHSARTKARWYELDPVNLTQEQIGNIRLPDMWYSFPSVSVNAAGDVVLGCTGSNPNIYAGAYYTGRLSSDAPGEMADAIEYKAGGGPYNQVDGNGINRWGDYSLVTVDPTDDMTFWMIQEHTRVNNRWGTRIAELRYLDACGSMTTYCSSELNSTGLNALLSGSGSTVIADNNLNLSVIQVPPNKFGYFLMSDTQSFIPLFGGSQGNLCLGSPLVRFAADIMQSTAQGTFDFSPDLSNLPQGTTFQPGSTWNFQLWYRDNNPTSTSNTSDGLAVQWCP